MAAGFLPFASTVLGYSVILPRRTWELPYLHEVEVVIRCVVYGGGGKE